MIHPICTAPIKSNARTLTKLSGESGEHSIPSSAPVNHLSLTKNVHTDGGVASTIRALWNTHQTTGELFPGIVAQKSFE
ncbi:MAG TPA: hypothetical protein ENG03_08835 [Thioploca sp.]|nr:MAG: hypothetical protein DRR19_05685 [Gammaproteobacteria bacterium]HDN27185.1 hypothetical protein [Thioploca sp.]